MTKNKKTTSARRKSGTKSEAELYKLPKSTVDEFIKSERRHDELDRMREVQEQKQTWRRTMFLCGLLNLIFLILAYIGWMNG